MEKTKRVCVRVYTYTGFYGISLTSFPLDVILAFFLLLTVALWPHSFTIIVSLDRGIFRVFWGFRVPYAGWVAKRVVRGA